MCIDATVPALPSLRATVALLVEKYKAEASLKEILGWTARCVRHKDQPQESRRLGGIDEIGRTSISRKVRRDEAHVKHSTSIEKNGW